MGCQIIHQLKLWLHDGSGVRKPWPSWPPQGHADQKWSRPTSCPSNNGNMISKRGRCIQHHPTSPLKIRKRSSRIFWVFWLKIGMAHLETGVWKMIKPKFHSQNMLEWLYRSIRTMGHGYYRCRICPKRPSGKVRRRRHGAHHGEDWRSIKNIRGFNQENIVFNVMVLVLHQ